MFAVRSARSSLTNATSCYRNHTRTASVSWSAWRSRWKLLTAAWTRPSTFSSLLRSWTSTSTTLRPTLKSYVHFYMTSTRIVSNWWIIRTVASTWTASFNWSTNTCPMSVVAMTCQSKCSIAMCSITFATNKLSMSDTKPLNFNPYIIIGYYFII